MLFVGTHRDDDSLEVIESLSRKTVLVSQLHGLSKNGDHSGDELLQERHVLRIFEDEVFGDLSKSTGSTKGKKRVRLKVKLEQSGR